MRSSRACFDQPITTLPGSEILLSYTRLSARTKLLAIVGPTSCYVANGPGPQRCWLLITTRGRQQLHARIAKILEERSPDTVAGQSALMARHCVEAGLNEKAVGYWAQGRPASSCALRYD
jgi:hypothetical protein